MIYSGTEQRAPGALISIVLPVFNECTIIRRLTKRICDVMSNTAYSFELIYVNDGSTDRSAAVLDDVAQAIPAVGVVHLSRNFGHQAAVHAGLSHSRGDAVVVMDSDLQDNPEAIPRFLEQWRRGFDVVYAERFNRKEAAWKRFLFFSFYRVLNAIADTTIPQDAGNFGLLDRRVVDTLLTLPEHDRFFPGLRHWIGYRQIGIPVERDARYDDKARVSLAGLFRLAKTAVFSFSAFPLTLFSVIAALSATVCAGSVGFVLYHKLVSGLAIPGWASVIMTASFFGALNAMGISVLGEYVIRIYDQVRHRPIHLVDRVVAADNRRPEIPPAPRDLIDEDRLLAMVHQIDTTLETSVPGSGLRSRPSDPHNINKQRLPLQDH
jgi:glycosyltransferase involved in cell wall biosynthesis